jgi:CheY-like chemotaxis protein
MRILIADDWPNVQNALRVLLGQQPGLEVVGEVADAGELLSTVEDSCPDTVLLGWELPGLEGGDVLPALRMICPDTRVVVLSGQPGARARALAAGADAFVSKVTPPEQLLSAILGTRQTGSGTVHSPMDWLWGQNQATDRVSCLGSPLSKDRGRRTKRDKPSDGRSTMAEVETKRKGTLKYVAVIAVAAVLLACIAAGLTVSLVLVNEIPFYHIFPR